MPEIDLIITHPEGLHARPAAELVKTAQQFQSEIVVGLGKWEANAKSILEILTLGADLGAEVHIAARGDDADQAIEAIRKLIETNFGDELDKTAKTDQQKDVKDG